MQANDLEWDNMLCDENDVELCSMMQDDSDMMLFNARDLHYVG